MTGTSPGLPHLPDPGAASAAAVSVPQVGASARRLRRPLDRAVGAVGPPPAPVLPAPWTVVPVEAEGGELDRVHRWMRAPHVAAFWRQDWPRRAWSEEVARQRADDHSRPWTVWRSGEPVAYVEVYRAARDVVADHYPAGPHDLGVHIAVGEAARTGRGLGSTLLRTVAEGLFRAEARCEAVVGDPEATHVVARRAFEAAGFRLLGEVDLPHKRAALLVCRRPSG